MDELRAEDPELGRVPVVGTGGLVREIARATELFDALDPDLTVRGNILMFTPLVKQLGASSLDDDDFVSVLVKWKTPKYKMSL